MRYRVTGACYLRGLGLVPMLPGYGIVAQNQRGDDHQEEAWERLHECVTPLNNNQAVAGASG